jgi:hypothetical protein
MWPRDEASVRFVEPHNHPQVLDGLKTSTHGDRRRMVTISTVLEVPCLPARVPEQEPVRIRGLHEQVGATRTPLTDI